MTRHTPGHLSLNRCPIALLSQHRPLPAPLRLLRHLQRQYPTPYPPSSSQPPPRRPRRPSTAPRRPWRQAAAPRVSRAAAAAASACRRLPPLCRSSLLTLPSSSLNPICSFLGWPWLPQGRSSRFTCWGTPRAAPRATRASWAHVGPAAARLPPPPAATCLPASLGHPCSLPPAGAPRTRLHLCGLEWGGEARWLEIRPLHPPPPALCLDCWLLTRLPAPPRRPLLPPRAAAAGGAGAALHGRLCGCGAQARLVGGAWGGGGSWPGVQHHHCW